MLAALVETSNDRETLLFLIEKSSGAPVTEGFLMTYD
jgi:hypothetical protein